ncbi:MAG: hypothetical protein C0600_15105 [Ignavibacteria bacterium]|nr:MAG: hypothetical protein C0600_15105 [Ignavibacteria bacterium]
MPYTDQQTTWPPVTAREAALMTRIAIALILLLLLPILVLAQPVPLTTTSIAGLLDSEIAAMHGKRLSLMSSETESRDADAQKALKLRPLMPQPAFPRAFHAMPVFESMQSLNAAEVFASSASSRSSAAALSVFSGARFRDVVQLHWEAASVPEVIGFQVERRSQKHNQWEMVGYVRSSARPHTREQFTFLDHLGDEGVAYYRLRQINADTEGSVSPVISVTPDNVLPSFSLWKHTMQPFHNYGTVSFGLSSRTAVKLTLHDRFGNTVATLLDYTTMDKGHHVLPFSKAALRPGLNTLRLHTAAGIQHIRVKHW